MGNLINSTQRLIFGLILLATAAVPLFFLPVTGEYFETNKFVLLLILTTLALLIWSFRMVIERKFVVTQTPINIPLTILTLVFTIASLTSIDQYSSLVGAPGRPWPSFLALATLATFFITAASNLKSQKQAAMIAASLVTSTTIAAIVAILSYFGYFFPAEFTQLNNFSPLGVINKLALLEAITLPIAIFWAINSPKILVKIAAFVATSLMVFSTFLINFWPAYVATATALVLIGLYFISQKTSSLQKQSAIGVAVIIGFFLLIRFASPLVRTETAIEIGLPQKAGWEIATGTIGKKPLLGSGPGTFGAAYTQLKPRYLNTTSLWAFRFDRSSSEFTEIATTTGIVGALAFLLLIVMTLRFGWQLLTKTKQRSQYLPYIAAILSFVILTFLTTLGISTIFAFICILVILCTLAKSFEEDSVYDVTLELASLKNKFTWFALGGNQGLVKVKSRENSGKSQLLPVIFLITVLTAEFFALRHTFGAYRAEYFYRQSLIAARNNDGDKTISFLQNAIRANPGSDLYHRSLAQTALSAAINLNQKKDPTDQEKQVLSQLIQVAIEQAKIASGYQISPLSLPGISATNVANWETIAAVYQALLGSVQGTDIHATNSLTRAVSLDPENPILHDRLGLLYQNVANLDLAQRKFEDAIIVKGDYGPAHFHLAKILIATEAEPAKIINALALAKRFLPENDPALEPIENDLTTYNQKLQEQQASKVAGEKSQTETTPQQPAASPKPTISPKPTAGLAPSPEPSPSPPPTGGPSPSP